MFCKIHTRVAADYYYLPTWHAWNLRMAIMDSRIYVCIAMSGKNRRLVADEPVEFEK